MIVFVVAWPWLASPQPQFSSSTLWILAASGLLQVALWLGLVAITSRPLFSLACQALGVAVLLLVNGLNYQYTGSAVVLVDVLGVMSVLGELDLFRLYVLAHWLEGLGLVALVGLLAFAAVRERPIVGWRWKALLGRVAIVAGVVWLFAPLTTGTSAAYRLLLTADASFNGHEPNASVARNGLFAHLMVELPELVVRLPENYGDPAVFERAVARMRVPSPTAIGGQLPHIVVILEESFFDPRRLNVKIDPPILTRFDEVTSKARYYGQMNVAVVGGGTVASEFSFLTGMPTNMFGLAGKWPFQTLVTDETWSMAKYLNSLGYETIAIYATPGSLFGGQAAYRSMGFQRFLDVSAFEANRDFVGPYVKDEAVSRAVVEIIGQATKPTFIFSQTMENHGPWGESARKQPPGRVSGMIDAENQAMLEDYILRLSDVENLAQRTADALKSVGAPVVFTVFGDHLPAMFSLYRQVGFSRPGMSPDRRQSSPAWFYTPYFVAAYPSTEPAELADVDISLLGSLVLDVAGLNRDDFFGRSSAFRRLCGGKIRECRGNDAIWRSYTQTLYNRLRTELSRATAKRGGTPAWGSPYDFGTAIIPGTAYLGAGWVPEAWGAWTLGREATVVLKLKTRVNMPLTILARVVRPSQTIREVEVLVNGQRVGEWRFDQDERDVVRSVVVPVSALPNGKTMTVTFRTAQPRSPREVSGWPDNRPLGIAFNSLVVCVPGAPGCRVGPGQGTTPQ
mgnify:FL=1